MDAVDKEQARPARVLTSAGSESGGYKIYDNGIITQRLNLRITMQEMSVLFPITFPNEVISLKILGGLDYHILDITAGGAKFSFSNADLSRQVKLVVSGL